MLKPKLEQKCSELLKPKLEQTCSELSKHTAEHSKDLRRLEYISITHNTY